MSHALVIINRNEPLSDAINKLSDILTVRETALSYISADKNSDESSPQPYHWKQCWATFLQ
jgi:hypothetical protein